MKHELLYRIGITLIPGIGVLHAKNLIAHCGSAEAVFREKKNALQRIPGIGEKAGKNILGQNVLRRAEREIAFIEKNGIRPIYFLDSSYPKRLKLCDDGPLMLYQKGHVDLNRHHIIALVGSRNATAYGKDFCHDFIAGLKAYSPFIISGLAYGIDICSHKAALENQLPTVGVLGHGLDRIYPSLHSTTARRMIDEGGGLITEFLSETPPDRENFPKRNRIVAGISDAIVVVEAARKGGALITAEIANSYNRDVFAVPGRLQDPFSEGCNYLIKTNKAALIQGVEDLEYLLGWEKLKEKTVQKQLFMELDETEKPVYEVLQSSGNKTELHILCSKSGLAVSKALPILTGLELKGVIRSYPGKMYGLV